MQEVKATGYPDGLFLSPAQVAAELRVSRSTVLRLIHAKKLPAIPAPRRSYRIRRRKVCSISGGRPAATPAR